MAFEGPVAVWNGPEHYHDTIEETPTKITENTILVMLGSGPIGKSSMIYTCARSPCSSRSYLLQAIPELLKWPMYSHLANSSERV